MQGINKVILLGWMGQNPELSYTAAQKAIVRFSLATNRFVYDDEGNKAKHVDWHTVVCDEALAEYCAHKLQKGSKVYVEGLLEYRAKKHHEHHHVTVQESIVVARNVYAIDGMVISEYPEDFPELVGGAKRKSSVKKDAAKASTASQSVNKKSQQVSPAANIKKDLFE